MGLFLGISPSEQPPTWTHKGLFFTKACDYASIFNDISDRNKMRGIWVNGNTCNIAEYGVECIFG